MNKAQLDALLAEGKITQEEYDAKLKEVDGGGAPDVIPNEQIQEMIREAINKESERLKAEHAKKLLEKEQELEALKAAKMTDEERKADELKKAEAELQKVKNELKKAEQERFINTELTKHGLSLEVAAFVQADDNQMIVQKIEAFKKLVDTQVKTEVDATFKKEGYIPNGSGANSNGVNPWAKETFNLTKQAQILKENPTLAKQLMAQAK